MSIKVVHEEISRFLKTPDAAVLCLKGKWGVGKTFAWNHYLQEAAQSGELSLKSYAYVSLFGLKSLDDVKYSLFEETINTRDLTSGPSNSSIEKSYKWVKDNYRKGAGVITRIPALQPYLGGSERSLFFLVRKQLVCIDDLERAGGELTANDILGLVSYLKEQRGCKIALLLNEEKLSNEAKDVLALQLEKVIDVKLDFQPTPHEAAEIVFPNPSGLAILLSKNCTLLGITNIRVIKRIEQIASRFEEIFGKESPLMTQIAHSVTLLGWAVYQPQEAPEIEFLKDFSRIHGLMRDKDKTPDKEKSWQELLRIYNYTDSDKFDLVILETIQNGYFDQDKLMEAGRKQLESFTDSDKKKAFEEAWNLYHDSFEDNENEVLDTIFATGLANIKAIEPMNLDSTIVFLKKFGRDAQARELLTEYVKAHSGERDTFDLNKPLFSRDVKDPDLIAAFEKESKRFKDPRDPKSVLIDIAINHGWNPEDIDLLQTVTTDDFYEIFKQTKGIDLHRILKSSLDFRKIGNLPDSTKEISNRAIAALKRIGKESELNSMRVSARGVKSDESSVTTE